MSFHRLMTSAFFATWLAASLRLSGPVLLAALGETFAECSGILNVGIEGTILLGALARESSAEVRDKILAGLKANIAGKWSFLAENPDLGREIGKLLQDPKTQVAGLGLVETPEDFGVRGKLPANSELLDWLATEFVAEGWDVKKLLTLLVTSATYRQSSRVTPESYERDPENRFASIATGGGRQSPSRFRRPGGIPPGDSGLPGSAHRSPSPWSPPLFAVESQPDPWTSTRAFW